MMKNVIIFHMESLSDVIFRLNEDCFPTISSWRSRMTYYSRYYSTATSTVMVMADLFFDDMPAFEKSEYLEDVYSVKSMKSSLFDILKEKGYNTYDLYYGYSSDKEPKKIHQLLNSESKEYIVGSREEYQSAITEIVNCNEPFALFLDDNASHICYSGKRLNREEVNGSEWFKERYRLLDDSFSILMEILSNEQLLNNTLIVMYGDHGEEFWFHGLYEGYTHAIEPFNNIIHCPLIVFDGSSQEEVNQVDNTLLSTIDIRQLIFNYIDFSKEKPNRKVAISRNLFANQSRLVDVFHKCFCATDGDYSLLVSNQGLELFNCTMDPFCQNNLLHFFKLTRDGNLKYCSKYSYQLSSHYKAYMSVGEQEYIRKRFIDLYSRIEEYFFSIGYNGENLQINKIAVDSKYRFHFFKFGKWKNIMVDRLRPIKRAIFGKK